MKPIIIKPQPKAFLLHSWMYLVVYVLFVVAIVFKESRTSTFNEISLTIGLFWVIGIVPVLVRSYLANRFSSCEIRDDKVVVTHGMFKWRREFTYKELGEVTADRSTLFGGKLWYSYFFTKKMMKKRNPVYSIALIGISKEDAYKLTRAIALKGVTVKKDDTLTV